MKIFKPSEFELAANIYAKIEVELQAELRGLTEQYDGRLARLQAQPAAAAGLQEAAERLRAALRRESGRGDAFYRTLLDGMEIRPDGTAALRLQGIPQEWVFTVKGPV